MTRRRARTCDVCGAELAADGGCEACDARLDAARATTPELRAAAAAEPHVPWAAISTGTASEHATAVKPYRVDAGAARRGGAAACGEGASMSDVERCPRCDRPFSLHACCNTPPPGFCGYGFPCTGDPVDWRARALAAERNYADMRAQAVAGERLLRRMARRLSKAGMRRAERMAHAEARIERLRAALTEVDSDQADDDTVVAAFVARVRCDVYIARQALAADDAARKVKP